MNYIIIENNHYRVKIDICSFTLGSGSLEYLIKEIVSNKWNWYNFEKGEKLYYLDGSSYVTCADIDNEKEVIVFE